MLDPPPIVVNVVGVVAPVIVVDVPTVVDVVPVVDVVVVAGGPASGVIELMMPAAVVASASGSFT